MNNEENLIKYYNKFNEDKRLERRHGIVEFTITIEYIEKYLKKYKNPKILDVGAGCGKYSLYLYNKGYDVSALDLVKHNLKVIEKKNSNIKTYLGNALDLSRFKDNSFDIVLLFGPLYHLISFKEKLQTLLEAKRILKDNGLIFISYCMNEFPIIKHGFIDNNIIECINNNQIDKDFKILSKKDDLYSYVRLDDIKKLTKKANLKQIELISQDSLTDYIRPVINKMDENTFNLYLNYVRKICKKEELLGYSSHVLSILKKN